MSQKIRLTGLNVFESFDPAISHHATATYEVESGRALKHSIKLVLSPEQIQQILDVCLPTLIQVSAQAAADLTAEIGS